MNAAAKVEKLIALTASSNENEARTAAFQACRLIREAGLMVLAPGDPRLAGARVVASASGVDLDQALKNVQDMQARSEETLRKVEETLRRSAWANAPAAHHPTEQEVAERKQTARRSRNDDPERVIVDAATPCRNCHRSQDKGRRMWRHEDRPGLTCGLCENGVA